MPTEEREQWSEITQPMLLVGKTVNLALGEEIRVFPASRKLMRPMRATISPSLPAQPIQIVIKLRDHRHPDAAKQALARVG